MQHWTSFTDRGTSPVRPARILIEDGALARRPPGVPPADFEVTTCAGPAPGERCPLVTGGSCPHGPFDVVVSALDGPWAHCVRAAWADAGVPVARAAPLDEPDPARRLHARLGAAVQRLWPVPSDGS